MDGLAARRQDHGQHGPHDDLGLVVLSLCAPLYVSADFVEPSSNCACGERGRDKGAASHRRPEEGGASSSTSTAPFHTTIRAWQKSATSWRNKGAKYRPSRGVDCVLKERRVLGQVVSFDVDLALGRGACDRRTVRRLTSKVGRDTVFWWRVR